MTVANGAVDLPTVQVCVFVGVGPVIMCLFRKLSLLPSCCCPWWRWRTRLLPARQSHAHRLLRNWFSTQPQAGNEAVLRARFEDAQFFYQNDLTTPLREAR